MCMSIYKETENALFQIQLSEMKAKLSSSYHHPERDSLSQQ